MRSMRVKRSTVATASEPVAANDHARRVRRSLVRAATVAKIAVAASARAAAFEPNNSPAITPITTGGRTTHEWRPRVASANVASGIRKSPKWSRIAHAGAKSASVRKSPRSPAPALNPARSSTTNGAEARRLTTAAAVRRVSPIRGRRAAATTPTPSVVVSMKRSQGLVATRAAVQMPQSAAATIHRRPLASTQIHPQTRAASITGSAMKWP